MFLIYMKMTEMINESSKKVAINFQSINQFINLVGKTSSCSALAASKHKIAALL